MSAPDELPQRLMHAMHAHAELVCDVALIRGRKTDR